MDKTWPLNIYTTININYWGNGDNYTIDEGAYHNQNWGRNMLLHNLKNQQIICENLPTNRLENALEHYNDWKVIRRYQCYEPSWK